MALGPMAHNSSLAVTRRHGRNPTEKLDFGCGDFVEFRSWKQSDLLIFGIIAMIGTVLLFTIKPGQPWDGDAELYIRNALNIMAGTNYTASSYFVSPVEPHYPAAYPPGLPLLLIPVLHWFGINYVAMKVELVFCFIGVLVMVAVLARHRLSPPALIILLIGLGLNPFILMFKDVVYSEFAFMLCAYGAILLLDRLDRRLAAGAMISDCATVILGAGLCIAAAIAVRTAGIALFAAALALIPFRGRRFGAAVTLVLVISLGLKAALDHYFPSDVGSYAGNLDLWRHASFDQAWDMLTAGLRTYAFALAELIKGPANDAAWALILAFAILGLAALRALRLGISRPDYSLAFLAVSLAMLIVYPIAQEPARYALPCLPIILMYALEAVDRRAMLPAGAALGALCAVGVFLRPVDDGLSVDRAEAHELYAQIKAMVPDQDVIIASHPTVISLYTGRPATNPAIGMTRENFWAFAHQARAHWLIANAPPMIDHLRSISPDTSPGFDRVYSNGTFSLFRLSSSE